MSTLEKIHARLDLYKEYLKYRSSHWYLTAPGKFYTMDTMGMEFIGKLHTFNEWLLLVNASDLIL